MSSEYDAAREAGRTGQVVSPGSYEQQRGYQDGQAIRNAQAYNDMLTQQNADRNRVGGSSPSGGGGGYVPVGPGGAGNPGLLAVIPLLIHEGIRLLRVICLTIFKAGLYPLAGVIAYIATYAAVVILNHLFAPASPHAPMPAWQDLLVLVIAFCTAIVSVKKLMPLELRLGRIPQYRLARHGVRVLIFALVIGALCVALVRGGPGHTSGSRFADPVFLGGMVLGAIVAHLVLWHIPALRRRWHRELIGRGELKSESVAAATIAAE